MNYNKRIKNQNIKKSFYKRCINSKNLTKKLYNNNKSSKSICSNIRKCIKSKKLTKKLYHNKQTYKENVTVKDPNLYLLEVKNRLLRTYAGELVAVQQIAATAGTGNFRTVEQTPHCQDTPLQQLVHLT